jgi:hypothetical protein
VGTQETGMPSQGFPSMTARRPLDAVRAVAYPALVAPALTRRWCQQEVLTLRDSERLIGAGVHRSRSAGVVEPGMVQSVYCA